jgi:hypothetical protein
MLAVFVVWAKHESMVVLCRSHAVEEVMLACDKQL